MGNYPPNDTTNLHKSCSTFSDPTKSSFDKVQTFLADMGTTDEGCFDLGGQVPYGKNGTVSFGDWSGVGSGDNGEMWDFQTCSLVVEQFSYEGSMFPWRPWTFEWIINIVKHDLVLLPIH